MRWIALLLGVFGCSSSSASDPLQQHPCSSCSAGAGGLGSGASGGLIAGASGSSLGGANSGTGGDLPGGGAGEAGEASGGAGAAGVDAGLADAALDAAEDAAVFHGLGSRCTTPGNQPIVPGECTGYPTPSANGINYGQACAGAVGSGQQICTFFCDAQSGFTIVRAGEPQCASMGGSCMQAPNTGSLRVCAW